MGRYGLRSLSFLFLIAVLLLSACTSRKQETRVALPEEVENSPQNPNSAKTSQTVSIAGELGLDIPSDHFLQTYETKGMSDAEMRGRLVWFQATTTNARFHTQVLPTVGIYLDWYKVLRTDKRDSRFRTWGVINDPDCKPGNEKTFGFDICAGDEQIYEALYNGKPFTDAACNLEKNFPGEVDPSFTRENGCLLNFGTSAGAVGFRKIVNPAWMRDPKGSLERWEKYNEGRVYKKWTNRNVSDASVEPPFLVGAACASCHVGLRPDRPPKNPEHPTWDNISGYIGGQHLRFSEIMASGMEVKSLPYQAFIHAPAGTVDTSQVPTDLIFNPGSINPIFNFDIRVAKNSVERHVKRHTRVNGVWKFVDDPKAKVPTFLKGGEDDVGVDLALERVYVNIGLCSEECWINHLVDFKGLAGRNTHQTAFEINQCRATCPSFRAIEDRIDDEIAFLIKRRPTPLKNAAEWVDDAQGGHYDENFGKNYLSKYDNALLKKGQEVFAKKCASCHSSEKPVRGEVTERFLVNLDYLKETNGVRDNWLGNDKRTPATEVGSNRCRALHTNHMGRLASAPVGSRMSYPHIWAQFSSDGYKNWRTIPIPDEVGENEGKGRGFYRNPSLLSVWMSLQLLHNKAIGEELCSYTPMTEEVRNGKAPQNCIDPYEAVSVKHRLDLFDKAITKFLYPEKRDHKVLRTDSEIKIKLGADLWPEFFDMTSDFVDRFDAKNWEKDFLTAQITIPAGIPVRLLGSIDPVQFLDGQIKHLGLTNDLSLAQRYAKLAKYFEEVLTANPAKLENELRMFALCKDTEEDKGHEQFLPEDKDKEALAAFLKTL